jgi:hypothetical protein
VTATAQRDMGIGCRQYSNVFAGQYGTSQIDVHQLTIEKNFLLTDLKFTDIGISSNSSSASASMRCGVDAVEVAAAAGGAAGSPSTRIGADGSRAAEPRAAWWRRADAGSGPGATAATGATDAAGIKMLAK